MPRHILPRNKDCHLEVGFSSFFVFSIENDIPGLAELLGGVELHAAAAIVHLWDWERAIVIAVRVFMDFHLHSDWQSVKLDFGLVEPVAQATDRPKVLGTIEQQPTGLQSATSWPVVIGLNLRLFLDRQRCDGVHLLLKLLWVEMVPLLLEYLDVFREHVLEGRHEFAVLCKIEDVLIVLRLSPDFWTVNEIVKRYVLHVVSLHKAEEAMIVAC